MGKPVSQDPTAQMRALGNQVRRMRHHTHPGIPNDPPTITGSRSDPSAILGQLLAALEANGQIIDSTTG